MKLNRDKLRLCAVYGGVGASGAWWAQYAGGWTEPDPASGMPKRERIAELLFSKEKGIGLDIYRYNLGGGSAESGKGTYVDRWRRAEAFLAPDGSMDFTRDKNAVDMLRLAVRYGASEVVFFVNSPPEAYTKNGMAQLGKYQILRTNLARKRIPDFVNYCLDAVEHFQKEGIDVKYLSPVNEPLWLWNGGQEGCHYSPRQVLRVLKAFAAEIDRRRLTGLRLAAAENGDIRWFNKAYTRACMKDPAVRKKLDGVDVHAYCIPQPFLPAFLNDRVSFLRRFRRYLDRRFPGVPVQTSEWTHMRGGRDAGMDSALETAKVMWEDFSILNVTKFSHWLACSHYDYCDGLLYLDPDAHTFTPTKRFYVTGQFSKYVPLGARRFEVSSSSDAVRCLGFLKDGKETLILINLGAGEETFSSPFDGLLALTDEARSMEESAVGRGQTVVLPPRSVLTMKEGAVC